MRIPVLIAINLLLTFAVMAQARAGESRDFHFEIKANGFKYGDFLIILEEDTQTYSLDVSAEAKGIFGFMLRAKYSGTTKGEKRADGTRQGLVFKARSSRIFADRTQQVTFKNGHPETVEILPLKRRTVLSDIQNVDGTFLDPLSFLANLVDNPAATCPPPVDLYDGRRITRVALEPATSQPKSLNCTGTYEIIKGPDHSLQKGVRKFRIVANYDRSSTGTLFLRKVEFRSGGNVILLKRSEN